MKVTIRDVETDEELGEIHEDGTIDVEDPMVEDDLEMMLDVDRAAPFRHTRRETEDGEEVIVEDQTLVKPGEQGYLVAVIENLTHPYAVLWDETDAEQLESPVIEENGGQDS